MTDVLGPGEMSQTSLTLLPLADVDSYAVDYHMHTEHTDGTASAQQMAKAAISQGIEEVLFSEHVRGASTYYPSFVHEVRSLDCPGLSVRNGIETKILDVDGNLDCSPDVASLCDAIVGSVHRPPADENGSDPSWSRFDGPGALELEFQLAMAIVTKSRAHILGHPMGMVVTRFNLKPLDQLYELARACRDYGKAFELNTRYCTSPSEWLNLVKRAGCKVSFGSDAHKTEDVGSAWNLFNRERLAGS